MRNAGLKKKIHLLCKEEVVVYGVYCVELKAAKKPTANIPVVGFHVGFCGALPTMNALSYSQM